MAVRKMMQQSVVRKNGELFFEQVGALRSNTFEVFYGLG